METSTNEIQNSFFSTSGQKGDLKGKAIVGITQLAVLLIITILFIILNRLYWLL